MCDANQCPKCRQRDIIKRCKQKYCTQRVVKREICNTCSSERYLNK